MMAREEKPVAENRKARHDYFIDEVIEAGLALTGTEVKSLRLGRVNLRDSFARVINGEVFLVNCHIAPYDKGNRWNHEPYRDRKLLLHKKEIRELLAKVKQEGMTLVPVRLYFDKQGRAKILLGVARGKKQYDKRRTMHEREVERHIDRVMKDRTR
jgi:SsrA-binding protein